jgi:hypothetical protein
MIRSAWFAFLGFCKRIYDERLLPRANVIIVPATAASSVLLIFFPSKEVACFILSGCLVFALLWFADPRDPF